jgi:hypothetical protein
LWGIVVLAIALWNPKRLWELNKIQGFVQLLGNCGTGCFQAFYALIPLVEEI